MSVATAKSAPLLAAVPCLCLLLAGCGGSDNQADGGASASASQSEGASASAAETPTTAQDDCTPGPIKIDGMEAVQHCGPATGEFTVGGTTVKVTRGKCESSMGAWVINVGATVVDPQVSQQERGTVKYLGIVAGEPVTDGSGEDNIDPAKVPDKKVVVAFTGGGIADSIKTGEAKLDITGPEPSGTFSGPTFDGQQVTGKFSCG